MVEGAAVEEVATVVYRLQSAVAYLRTSQGLFVPFHTRAFVLILFLILSNNTRMSCHLSCGNLTF
jgi:hypothetical protein